MTRFATILALVTLAGPAFGQDEEKDFALRGATEVGGTVSFSRFSDSATDTTLTDISVRPFAGYFLAPSFAIVGSIDVHYQDPGDDGTGSDTDVAVLAGAGYFLPAGSIYIGPQLQVGYGQIREENAFVGDGQAVLKIKIGSSALANLSGGYRYIKLFGDAPNDGSISGLAFSFGFSVWF
jgi:hypothetical protein